MKQEMNMGEILQEMHRIEQRNQRIDKIMGWFCIVICFSVPTIMLVRVF